MPKKTSTYFDFGSLENYSATGGGLPPSKYAMFFEFVMRTPQDKQGNAKGATHLSAKALCYDLVKPGDEPREQFWGMGKKAHESWLPDPEDPKRLVAVEGGPGGGLDNRTNWYIFLKSMYDAGLPNGTLADEVGPTIAALDGVWVLTGEVPEPAERQGMSSGAASGEVAGAPRQLGKIAVVVDFVDEGKPWEGGGGMPKVGKAAAAKATTGKPVAKKKADPEPEEEAEPETETDGIDLASVAESALSEVLGKNENGMSRLKLKIESLKVANKKFGEEAGTNFVDAYFPANDPKFKLLSGVLGELDFQLVGSDVKKK